MSRLVPPALLTVAIGFIWVFLMVVVKDDHSSYRREVVDMCNIINRVLNIIYTLTRVFVSTCGP